MSDKRTTFNEVAELYDKVRPHYPELLFQELASLARLPASARILEIGAGTGIATEPLLQKGYQVIALEPGEELSQYCQVNILSFAPTGSSHKSVTNLSG